MHFITGFCLIQVEIRVNDNIDLSLNEQLDPVNGVEPVLVGKGAKDHPEYAMTDFAHYSKEVEQVEDFLEWKDKVEAYCVADCVSLYQLLILAQFNHLVYGNWKINITKFPTTPALAFAIFTSAYYSKSQYN